MTARIFVAFPIVLIVFGVGVTIWWITDGFWRLIQHFRKASG